MPLYIVISVLLFSLVNSRIYEYMKWNTY